MSRRELLKSPCWVRFCARSRLSKPEVGAVRSCMVSIRVGLRRQDTPSTVPSRLTAPLWAACSTAEWTLWSHGRDRAPSFCQLSPLSGGGTVTHIPPTGIESCYASDRAVAGTTWLHAQAFGS